MHLIFFSIVPVVVLLIYIVYRDKYEREPLKLLLKALFVGMLSVVPILFVEKGLMQYSPELSVLQGFYRAFFVAGFTEELFKFLAFVWIIWPNKNFNEKFDGIVYAVFISLGFAVVENIMYVFEQGIHVAYLRALTAVPAHALFGVTMGYYLGLAKFYPDKRREYLTRAFLEAFILHGVYDFILMAGNAKLFGLFVPYIAYVWFIGFKRIKALSNSSIYRR